MRTAIGGDQDRGYALAKAAANVPDRGEAVAAVEMIVDQQAGDWLARGPDRLHGGVRGGRRRALWRPGVPPGVASSFVRPQIGEALFGVLESGVALVTAAV